jgi:hypothetical protein
MDTATGGERLASSSALDRCGSIRERMRPRYARVLPYEVSRCEARGLTVSHESPRFLREIEGFR